MTNRDKRGRFVAGNTTARRGWAGLVQRRFAGDEQTAKRWLGQLGRWAYGQNYRSADGQYMPWVKMPFRQHPGQPEQFAAEYRQRLEFTLNDIQEMRF